MISQSAQEKSKATIDSLKQSAVKISEQDNDTASELVSAGKERASEMASKTKDRASEMMHAEPNL